MKRKWIFDSFKEWRNYLFESVKLFGVGIAKVLYSFVFGIISVCVYIGKKIEAFCKRETTAALIIGFVFCAVCVGCVYVFTQERHARVEAQHKADSLSYELGRITQIASVQPRVNNDSTVLLCHE